ELILPPDPVERQLLQAVAAQAHIPAVVAQLMATTSLPSCNEKTMEKTIENADEKSVGLVGGVVGVAGVGRAMPDLEKLHADGWVTSDEMARKKKREERAGGRNVVIPPGWEF